MQRIPTWLRGLAILALLWNLLGCWAFLADQMLTASDIARLPAAQQALYAGRPLWAAAATGVAVFGGALGSLALAMGRRWSRPLLLLSLIGVIVQDVGLFGLAGGWRLAGGAPILLQGIVLLVAIGLVLLARRAGQRGWLD